MNIRPAQASDEAAVLRLIAELRGSDNRDPSWAQPFRQLLTGERGGVLVADDSEGLLGTITYSFNLAIRYSGEYCQIEELIVWPRARRTGAGKALVEACIAAARTRGCAEIGLYVVNPDNMAFYARYGFEDVGPEVRMRLD